MKIITSACENMQYTPVFICGAPRTGTTLLLSLICTSMSTNPLSAECDYFTTFVQPFIKARDRFDLHTECYFSSMDAFQNYHSRIMKSVLDDMWASLSNPSHLVLKDPGMTRYANIILSLVPECKMLVCVRHPRDVIASRVAIEMRRCVIEDVKLIDPNFIASICQEYNAVYEYVVALEGEARQKVKIAQYESLVDGKEIESLSAFLALNDINPDKLWSRSVKMGKRKTHNEWMSPLYGQKMTSTSVGNYKNVLSDSDVQLIDEMCAVVYDKLLFLAE